MTNFVEQKPTKNMTTSLTFIPPTSLPLARFKSSRQCSPILCPHPSKVRTDVKSKPASILKRRLLTACTTINTTKTNTENASQRTISDPIDDKIHSVCSTFGFSHPSFIEAVCGEWFGYQVTFSAKTGAAQEIEERFVPGEFRTWGVTITGFDTLTSSKVAVLTDTLTDTTLHTKLTRALPTVGCEADAIAGEITETVYLSSSFANGGFPDGSYTTGPLKFDASDLTHTFSCAIVDSKKRKRARLQFGRVDELVSSVVVIIERWDGPYCGGAILPGCGGPDSSFASEERTTGEMCTGDWDVKSVVCAKSQDWRYEEVEKSVEGREEDSKSFLLPRGLSLKIGDESGEVCVEAAWDLGDGVRSAVRRYYSKEGGGMLNRVEVATEAATEASRK